jgi:hypothetical protein
MSAEFMIKKINPKLKIENIRELNLSENTIKEHKFNVGNIRIKIVRFRNLSSSEDIVDTIGLLIVAKDAEVLREGVVMNVYLGVEPIGSSKERVHSKAPQFASFWFSNVPYDKTVRIDLSKPVL